MSTKTIYIDPRSKRLGSHPQAAEVIDSLYQCIVEDRIQDALDILKGFEVGMTANQGYLVLKSLK